MNKIREQCQKQEDTINEQEGELNAKRSELQKLKDEENSLQKEYDENNRELQKLTNHLQNTQLQISSVSSAPNGIWRLGTPSFIHDLELSSFRDA